MYDIKYERKNKNKNVAGAPPENPSSSAPPPPIPPVEETTIPNIAEVGKEAIDLAIDIALAAFKNNRFDKDVAEEIKNEFDNRYGPTWHCIVGRDFGYFINHETNCYIRFQVGVKNVLLFKSG